MAFVIVTSTLYAFYNFIINDSGFLDLKITKENTGDQPLAEVLTWISNNQIYLILIALPFISLGSYLAFIRSKLNYFEHFVLIMYITGQQMVISLICSVLYLDNWLFSYSSLILIVLFNYWTYIQLFNNKKLIIKILLVTLVYALLIVQFLIGIVSFTLIYRALFPEVS